jgi:PAS domain-containing protein
LFRNVVTVVVNHGMVQLDIVYGWWHNAVFVPYQYAFHFASLYLLLDSAITTSRVFRGRLLLLAAAIVLPMVGATFYILGLPPFHVFNPTSVLIMVSFILFGATMLRHHTLDVVPVARHLVLDTLNEAIIVLDLDDRIVDFNAAASSMFASLNAGSEGADFVETLGDHDALLALARGIESVDAGFALQSASGPRHCLGRGAAVIGVDGSRIGRVITVTDITDRVPDDTVWTDSAVADEPIVVSSGRFFGQAAAEMQRARRFGRPLHLLVISMPDRLPGDEVADAIRALTAHLRPWERLCFAGTGRFMLSMPEEARDGATARAQEILRGISTRWSGVAIGISSPRDDREESPEEVVVRAVRAAAGVASGVASLER